MGNLFTIDAARSRDLEDRTDLNMGRPSLLSIAAASENDDKTSATLETGQLSLSTAPQASENGETASVSLPPSTTGSGTILAMIQTNLLPVPQTNGNGGNGTVSQPPSPPQSGTTTPRVSIAQCPERLTPLYPAANFGCVDEKKIYRSGFLEDRNVRFIDGLDIKSVLTLVETESRPRFKNWVEARGVLHAKMSLGTNKEGEKFGVTNESICEALIFIMNSASHPVYVHCNQGKHRTGCVIACLRKVQGWSSEEAIDEYNTYAGAKSRLGDRLFIQRFKPQYLFLHARKVGIVGDRSMPWNAKPGYLRCRNPNVADIDSLRAALDEGLVADFYEDDMDLDSSPSSSVRSTSPPTRVPASLPSINARMEDVQKTERVQDSRFVAHEVEVDDEGSTMEGIEAQFGSAPLESNLDPACACESQRKV